MNSPDQHDAQLRAALRRAAFEQRKVFRSMSETSDGLLIPTTAHTPKAAPSPEHYHIIYNVPKDGLSIPDMNRVYVTSKEAYQKIWDTAQQAEPNVEYYDENGTIGIETRLHGRADLWWIVLEVAACIRSKCLKTLNREQQKRKLVLVPGME